MIKGVHTMFYSSDAKELREFFRDKLGLFVRLSISMDISLLLEMVPSVFL